MSISHASCMLNNTIPSQVGRVARFRARARRFRVRSSVTNLAEVLCTLGMALSCALALLQLRLPAASTSAMPEPACEFKATSADGGCLTWDLSGLPTLTWLLNDSYPEPYLVSSPCATADYSPHLSLIHI